MAPETSPEPLDVPPVVGAVPVANTGMAKDEMIRMRRKKVKICLKSLFFIVYPPSEGRESSVGFGAYVRMIIVCADKTQGSGISHRCHKGDRSAVSADLCLPGCGFLPLRRV